MTRGEPPPTYKRERERERERGKGMANRYKEKRWSKFE